MPGQHIFERAAMVTGLLACAASSPGSAWSTASFVHNLTDEPIDLRIRWTDAALDCDALRGKTGLALDRSVFREGSTFQLDPSTTLPLERRAFQDPFAAPAPVDVPTEDDLPPKDTRCSIALISADGFDDTLIFWSQLPTLSVPPFLEDEDPNFSTDGRLTFTKEDDAMVMSPGAGLDVAPILDQIDPSSCRDSRPTRFQWTNDFPARLRTTLTDVSVGPDGCIGMVLDGVDERLYLCIPSERFLYAPGDILDVTHERLSQGRSLNIVRDATAEKRRLEITVYSGVKRFDDALVSGEVEELECGGRRLSCGAFSIPAAISLNDGGRLTAGSATEFYDSSMNANVSLHIGRAEHTLVGTDRCDTARRRAGISADILIVYEEVE